MKTWYKRAAKNIPNRVMARTQPFLTPFLTSKLMDVLPSNDIMPFYSRRWSAEVALVNTQHSLILYVMLVYWQCQLLLLDRWMQCLVVLLDAFVLKLSVWKSFWWLNAQLWIHTVIWGLSVRQRHWRHIRITRANTLPTTHSKDILL
jgi:hypothetical protein